ncbi:MAG: acyl-CoA dehydrogenase family protein [Chloroflexi bacterium]|nr:acyl-CoA dehydrogenase family protein [Chloroflexota bacterium]
MTSTKAHDPVAAAKALAPQIRAARDEMQSRCRLPGPLAEAMARAGLFQLYAPSAIGGPETDPLTAFRAVEELSRVDGSVGWCSFVASAVSIYAGWLPAELGRELFGQPLNIRVAGSFRPTGQAQAVDGGYKVGGRWNYMSGVDHANWLFLNCNIMDGDGSVPMPALDAQGLPVTRMMIVPADAGVIEETWSTLGMRGTGSNDLVIEETFVPEERTYLLYGPSPLEGPHYDPRTVTVTSWALVAANALGMARGAMDTFVRLATESGSTASPTLLRDRTPIQTTTGEAEAIISGARAYVLDAVGAVWEAACRGVSDPGPQVLQARLAITHAMRESVRAVDLLFYAAGTNAIHEHNDLELFFRDVHTAGQHIAALHSNFEYGGQALLGLTPGAPGW